ncbi:hypothetical protein SEA_WEASELS2_178 [Rhodococcus phage Weasels2]|uniref:Uncharacterized protein n=1 Tax=Rhodococcus phage Weasels2 TaxID=1897437 RepID=A0A1I9SAF1_9CAUD|nr:hypothetical protein FDH04_gp237 [Rhodococcus phage Weasels2]AOZ63757.1 hypothetical protein SEA_WEASELS2_178 [Rhodococcus phage Weasels2]
MPTLSQFIKENPEYKDYWNSLNTREKMAEMMLNRRESRKEIEKRLKIVLIGDKKV